MPAPVKGDKRPINAAGVLSLHTEHDGSKLECFIRSCCMKGGGRN